MAEKKEAFGLSLLDVLSNALLGGIVLMIIAAVNINIQNMQSDLEKDDEIGESQVNTDSRFKPVDSHFKSNAILTCFFRIYGGNTSLINMNVIPMGTRTNFCFNISRGYYESDYWLITRDCKITDADKWKIIIKTDSQNNLPDSIHIHINAGLRPVSIDPGIRRMKNTRMRRKPISTNEYELFTIQESESGVPEVY